MIPASAQQAAGLRTSVRVGAGRRLRVTRTEAPPKAAEIPERMADADLEPPLI